MFIKGHTGPWSRWLCCFEHSAIVRLRTISIAMLDEFLTTNRVEIITRCRAKVATRLDPVPTRAEIDHGVPMFLDQLREELRHGPSPGSNITRTATRHGRDLLRQGYTVSQVVHDYGDVCQSITELAVERHVAITASDFQTLNRCLDDAIAGAVTEYGRERAQPSERDDTFEDARRGILARDLMKTIQILKVAFEAIRSGRVGVAGSTGAVLSLALATANDLAERLLTEPIGPSGTASADS